MTQFKNGDRVVSRDSGCGGTVMNQILTGGRAWVEWDDGTTSNVLTSRLKHGGKFKVGDRVRSLASEAEGEVLAVDSRDETVEVSWDSGFQSTKCAATLRLIDDGNTSDAVNPAHYKRFPVEVIEITEHLSFNLGNAVKYCARAGHKPGADEIEDLRKAAWYIQREIDRLEAAKSRAEIVRDK